MPYFCPEELSIWSGGKWNREPDSISGFSIDSRKVGKKNLFVAIRAERDGHSYIKKAHEQGASAAIVDHEIEDCEIPQLIVDDTLHRFQEIARKNRERFEGKVVGVTGSCGKTTTKEILKTLLDRSLCTQGNLNNHLGVPLTLTKVSSNEHIFSVIEAGINNPGEMDDLVRMIQPDIAVITSVSASHLEGLGSLNTVAEEKIKLWSGDQDSPICVFPEELLTHDVFLKKVENGDAHIRVKKDDLGKKNNNPHLVTYNLSTETNERGHSYNLVIERYGCPPLLIPIQLASRGTIQNMVLACVVAWKLGVTDEMICERLPQYRPSGLRGSSLVGRGRVYVLDCYNANPASMIDSIDYFYQQYVGEPKLLVLGGMNELGKKSNRLHYETGKSIFLEKKDRAVLIGNDAPEMAKGIRENGASCEQVLILSDVECARPIVEEFEGVVLFKGSRSFRLESLVPSWAVEKIESGVALAC